MILTFIKFFRGFLQIRISGRDRERFINLCTRKDILLWNLYTKKEYYYCNISVQGFFELKDIAHKTHVNIRICKRCGVPFLLYRYRKRKMFFVSFCAAVIGIYILSGFLWRIEVQGNQSIDKQIIVDYLKENKITYGTKLSGIDIEKAEQQIRENFTDVAWTSIDISGTCLTVFLKENLISEDINDEEKDDLDKGYDLIAPRDGVIESIVTRSGTPQVIAQDNVKKGNILVAGYVPIMNEAKEIDSYLFCKSDADVFIRFVEEYQYEFPLTYEKKSYTNKNICFYTLETSHPVIYFQDFFQNRNYDVLKEKKQLKLWGNYYLPLYSNKYVCQKFEYQTYTYSKEEAYAYGNQCFLQFLDKMQQKGIQIISKNVMINNKDDVCKVTGEIIACELVDTYQLTSIDKATKIDKGSNNNESR